jgi:RNA polymerase sigma-70 factor (ECF subfamily)
MSEEGGYIQLLSQARTGDRESLGRLATLAWERLYPFVLRTTLNHDVTEDVLQETLLEMVARVGGLRNEDRFWPWLYRIAYSKIQDRLRSRKLESRLHAATPWTRRLRGDTQRDDESMLDAQIRAETRETVLAAIEKLTRNQRDVLHLRYFEQLPYTEIASRTRTTPAKARVRSHRAKKSLKQRLACCV